MPGSKTSVVEENHVQTTRNFVIEENFQVLLLSASSTEEGS